MLIFHMGTKIVFSFHALVTNVTNKCPINSLGHEFVKVFLG